MHILSVQCYGIDLDPAPCDQTDGWDPPGNVADDLSAPENLSGHLCPRQCNICQKSRKCQLVR